MQEKKSAARPAPAYNKNSGSRQSSMVLPEWYTNKNKYTCNTTMPSLAPLKKNLQQRLSEDQDQDITMGHFVGVYCPVHLCEGRLHVHHSNGVYIALKVTVYSVSLRVYFYIGLFRDW